MAVVNQAVAFNFPTVAAASDEEIAFAWPYLGKWRIQKVILQPNTAVTFNATNFLTATCATNDGAGGAFAAIGSLDTTAVSLAVDTTREMTLLTTAAANAAREVQQGYGVRIAKTEGGTGQALDGCFTIIAERLD